MHFSYSGARSRIRGSAFIENPLIEKPDCIWYIGKYLNYLQLSNVIIIFQEENEIFDIF